MMPEQLNTLDWDKGDGLLPAIVQDASTGKVLMLGYMNREALSATMSTQRVTFYSRSKQRLWTKGETSGHTQKLAAAYIDCDGDALLLKVDQTGPACHTGARSCFFNEAGGPIE